MTDNSVLRLDDVPVVIDPDDDDRITFIPDVMDIATYTNDNRRAQLPRRN